MVSGRDIFLSAEVTRILMSIGVSGRSIPSGGRGDISLANIDISLFKLIWHFERLKLWLAMDVRCESQDKITPLLVLFSCFSGCVITQLQFNKQSQLCDIFLVLLAFTFYPLCASACTEPKRQSIWLAQLAASKGYPDSNSNIYIYINIYIYPCQMPPEKLVHLHSCSACPRRMDMDDTVNTTDHLWRRCIHFTGR